MVDILRPDYGQAWASEGEKLAPAQDKVAMGWVQEMMPFQYENFLQARQDEALLYLLQKGVPEYSATQEYTANKSIVQYQGDLYLSTATVTGVLPTVTASWRRLSPTLASNGTVSVAGGGTGATSAAQARANLGLGDASTATLPTSTGVVVKGSGNALISRLLTGTSGDIVITNPDGVAGNINVGVGSNVVKSNQDSSWTSKGGITLPKGSSGERGVEVPGKIRYNTELQKFEGYNGTSWDTLGAASEVEITTLSGDGTTTVFTLNTSAFSESSTDVYVGGVWQNKGTYSVSGAQITFSEAPTPGTENVQVISRKVVDLGLARASQISLEDSANLINATTVEGALREIVETSGTITTSAEWGSVPSHSNPKLDLQATALANRTELLRLSVARASLFPTYEISDFEENFTGKLIDLEGGVYEVSEFPKNNKYINGFFNNSNGQRGNIQPSHLRYVESGNNQGIKVGDGILPLMSPNWSLNTRKTNILVGFNIGQSVSQTADAIAIGSGNFALSDIIGHSNIAIGHETLRQVQASSPYYQQTDPKGTRNIGVGSLALRFLQDGYSNVAIGRNAGQCLEDGMFNVAIGTSAMSGDAPVGLSGDIENYSPSNAAKNTAIGHAALARYVGFGEITAVGHNAAYQLKKGATGVAVGAHAIEQADSAIDGFGKVVTWSGSESGTYSQSGESVVISLPNTRGAVVGGFIRFRFLDGAAQTLGSDIAGAYVTSVTATTITIASPVSMIASGSAVMSAVYSTADATSLNNNFAIVGAYAAQNSPRITEAALLGGFAGQNSGSLNRAVMIGSSAGREGVSHDSCVGIGRFALANPATTYGTSIGIGQEALRYAIDGTSLAVVNGSIAIGNQARVTGSNQFQLGPSGTTTYAYGAVQDRSDARDKADVRDTVLGLEFIKDIRAVDFKWDMRDDYVQTNEDGTVTVLEKDGSRKRTRYHHGVIAQELRAVMEKHGVDFGGFQDHSQNGGCDVLSVGYTELIAPLIKAVQELSARVEALEAEK